LRAHYARQTLDTSTDFAAAAFEFERYLSDRVPPLMIEEEFGVLLRNPPAALVGATMHWMTECGSAASGEAQGDLIIHAVRKMALMGEFDLVPRVELAAFMTEYSAEILEACPVADRTRVSETCAALISGAIFGAETPPPAAPKMAPEILRRMEVFLKQLGSEAPGERRDEVASEFMATAALGSFSREELDATLAPLRSVGIDPATENVLNQIARSLPGWGAIEFPTTDPPRRGRLGAMRQIVALGEDAAEVAKRFREMVHAGIARFNEGDVGRAQSILILAQQMAEDEQVQAPYVESLRNAHDYLDLSRLRAAADKPENLSALRTVMSFFHGLSPEGLLKSLREESDENRRHDISSLLEVHGAVGRALALEQLNAADVRSDYLFAASALRLLRRIPPPEGSADAEIEVVLRHATRDTKPVVATQAIYCLGQSKGERAERALLGLLRNYEGLLTRPTAIPSSITAEDISGLLDRTCDALARRASPPCLRALVDHGLKTDPALGDCARRLAEGSHADFSGHPELLKRLIDGLRAELPRGLLGLQLRKELGRSASFVRALSGTPSAQVATLFQEIVRKHGEEDFGVLAAEALEGFAARVRAAEASSSAFSGDLAFFGLPMLLQTVSQGQMTGVVTLINAAGVPASKLWFLLGRLLQAGFGRLSGEDALYELLIRPFPGTFAFVHRKDGPTTGVLDPPADLMGLIFEGVRRHDEWKRSAALVPDDARLLPTGKPRLVHADEAEDLVEAVWAAVASGATARECESRFPVDSHRVRGLLASWVETDALTLG
jgi:Domain of unknown function (DUF4388)